jgi:hypothetical protein
MPPVENAAGAWCPVCRFAGFETGQCEIDKKDKEV